MAVVIHNHPRLPYHTSFIKLTYNELHASPSPPLLFPLHFIAYDIQASKALQLPSFAKKKTMCV